MQPDANPKKNLKLRMPLSTYMSTLPLSASTKILDELNANKNNRTFPSTLQLDRAKILDVMDANGILEPSLISMLDYTIELFESHGLGADYYGYHNVIHELAVTYVMLLSASRREGKARFTAYEIKHLYAAALFHDFDPYKNVDKPHEKSVLRFIDSDENICSMVKKAGLDINLVKILILRTTYPWRDEVMIEPYQHIQNILKEDNIDEERATRYMHMGWYLSVVDRIGGYALSNFIGALEMAKMNAHALAWKPSLIVRRSVAYFEDLLNNEQVMCRSVLKSLPHDMRKNFFNTILTFMKLRSAEIAIRAEHTYDNLKLEPTIETISTRRDPKFIESLYRIFVELPRPLQFGRDRFQDSVQDPETILTTLRLNGHNGRVIGFAKGGALEWYELDPKINDINYGMHNTVFLEPLALQMGYWGLRGGSMMRWTFMLQAYSKGFAYLTSFALREVIQARVNKDEAEFVAKFNPERWDYYRAKL